MTRKAREKAADLINQFDGNTESKELADLAKAVLNDCPQLKEENDSKKAACIALAYRIGISDFERSTVCRLTGEKLYARAADAFLLWNKAAGRIVPEMTQRCRAERDPYLQ